MTIFDEKEIFLNDGEKDVKVKVYLKKINIRNEHTDIRVFSKLIKD
ncbi:MAG: hypothetical protein ABIJ08_06180 [Nanoarchaeota archaeon]